MSWIDGKPVLKHLVIKLSVWNWLFLSIFLGGWEKSLYYLSGIIQPTCVTNSRETSNLVYIFVQYCLLCYKFLISISKTLVQLKFSLLSNCNTFLKFYLCFVGGLCNSFILKKIYYVSRSQIFLREYKHSGNITQ